MFKSARHNLALVGVTVPLLVAALYIGYVSPDQFVIYRQELMANPSTTLFDSVVIVEDSLRVARLQLPSHGGGPGRYLVLAPLLAFTDGWLPAFEISSAAVAVFAFVVIPLLSAWVASRHSGPLAGLLAVCTIVVLHRGLLSIVSPPLPSTLILLTPQHYFSNHWQHVFATTLFLSLIVIGLSNVFDGDRPSLQEIILYGVGFGGVAFIQYVQGSVDHIEKSLSLPVELESLSSVHDPFS